MVLIDCILVWLPWLPTCCSTLFSHLLAHHVEADISANLNELFDFEPPGHLMILSRPLRFSFNSCKHSTRPLSALGFRALEFCANILFAPAGNGAELALVA
ncbi:hypothetical protein PF008_g21138 [Phytophthora fragariae]|uniref:Secreted protein n=1 Tax=Phytophthora fragariae TaxID=53985 RepID=A0A6G0QYM0_9STRA|nr:hypothetical protein PF008_g21138 [Phytophthora fragariae]